MSRKVTAWTPNSPATRRLFSHLSRLVYSAANRNTPTVEIIGPRNRTSLAASFSTSLLIEYLSASAAVQIVAAKSTILSGTAPRLSRLRNVTTNRPAEIAAAAPSANVYGVVCQTIYRLLLTNPIKTYE